MLFQNPFRGQLTLSNSAMKAAAKTFKETGSADSSIRSGLRRDMPLQISIMMNGSRTTIDQQILWVFGTTGSGKSEMGFDFAKENSARGGRTCIISPKQRSETLRGEHPFHTGPDWREADLCDDIRRRDRPISVIDVANICLNQDDYFAQLRSAMSVALSADADLIILDDVVWGKSTDDVSIFLREVRKSGKRLVILSQEWMRLPLDLITPADAVILMKIVCGEHYVERLSQGLSWFPHDFPPYEDVMSFQSGDGFLVSLSRFGIFNSRYSSLKASRIPKPAARAVEILSGSNPNAPYLKRLDAVARACGYRSWDAANKSVKDF